MLCGSDKEEQRSVSHLTIQLDGQRSSSTDFSCGALWKGRDFFVFQKKYFKPVNQIDGLL